MSARRKTDHFGTGPVEEAREQLQSLLGAAWRVAHEKPTSTRDQAFDAVWQVYEPSEARSASLKVIARYDLAPLEARSTAMRVGDLACEASTVVVAEWLSPRTREVLQTRGINYLDLTGNAFVRLDQPAVVIRTEGAQRNPTPTPRSRGMSGLRASRLVRELVDHHPPRRTRELSAATGLSESYVSRLLDVMTDEALIARGRDRTVTDIDWSGLLRERGSHDRLLKENEVLITTPRRGLERTIALIAENAGRPRAEGAPFPALATGQYPATAIAPLAVGGNLMLYVDRGAARSVTQDLGLLRAERTTESSILLLLPKDDTVFKRPWPELLDGLPSVGVSQLVLDCLSGPGRLPEQAEALLDWMSTHESTWRRTSTLP
ncbi:hypothetical protein [Saccharomonospora piscinae]|uniref:hypothetical protein n=1 Tax=Saccharomonospora piscinae TaxID=687388 RepID=UPI0004657A06|nr:hypothetical protein [Saccharomonospora piscinae]